MRPSARARKSRSFGGDFHHPGMIIAVAVLNAKFGPTMDCFVNAGNSPDSTRRQMFEEMDHIAAQNPSTAARCRAAPSASTAGARTSVLPLKVFSTMSRSWYLRFVMDV